MADILIDDIDDDILESLRIKAELRGISLEDFARELIEDEGAALVKASVEVLDGSSDMTPKE